MRGEGYGEGDLDEGGPKAQPSRDETDEHWGCHVPT